jgi:hypothetical protein
MTETGAYDYCKIFIKHESLSFVSARLATLLDATVERRTLLTPGLILDVQHNPDADPSAGDDFVRWPLIIDVEPDDTNAASTMSKVVATIITDLWNADIPTVAACDFEEELPWSGGIRRLNS